MNKRKILSVALALVMLVTVFALPLEVFAAEEETVITILHTNDVHGNAMEDEKSGKLGFAKLKAFVDSKEDAILLDAGDMTHGTTFATISSGVSIIELMNKLGYKAMVPGNHDYNYGKEGLAKLNDIADFPILQANIVDANGKTTLNPNTIIEVNGVKVGIFGIVTPETKNKSNPKNTMGLTFVDYIKSAEEQVAELKEEGADVIVALVHLGLDAASVERSDVLAEKVDGIDLIVDGHSHSVLPEGKVVNDTLITQAGEHLKNIGEVTINVKNGEIVSKTAQLHPYEELKDLKANEDILKAIEKVEETNKPFLERVVGKTDVELDGVRENVRAGETNLGNLITDAMLDVSGADIAITNGGGIRASIDVGDITMGEILQSFPFTNYPVVLEIKGADVLEALEFGVDSAPEVVGKFPHVGGMTFKYDPNQAPGNRVFDAMVGEEALDPEKTYKLVTNDFMAVGGDGYEMLAKGTKLAEYPLLSEVLAKYIEANETVKPEVEGRITIGEKPLAEGEEKVEKPRFDDIENHWAKDYILAMADENIFIGVGGKTFAPETKISRAMLLTTLHRIDGEKDAKAKANYKDIKEGDWYKKSIAWAVENKVALENKGEEFKPNEDLSREEMAVILANYLAYKEVGFNDVKPKDFADEGEISDFAKEGIDRVVVAGIMEGKLDNMFDPQGTATRAEVAKVLYKVTEILEKIAVKPAA